jgi:hypothetical protein
MDENLFASLTQDECSKYEQMFDLRDFDRDGLISGEIHHEVISKRIV